MKSLSSITIASYAAMAKLADALDSGSSRGNPVEVQLLLAAFPLAATNQQAPNTLIRLFRGGKYLTPLTTSKVPFTFR